MAVMQELVPAAVTLQGLQEQTVLDPELSELKVRNSTGLFHSKGKHFRSLIDVQRTISSRRASSERSLLLQLRPGKW